MIGVYIQLKSFKQNNTQVYVRMYDEVIMKSC